MAAITSSPPLQQRNLFNIISWTALLVGTLDIASAIIKFYMEHGQGPEPIFRYIASGIFGKEAKTGGTLMVVWGAVFHYMIAFLFTVILFTAYPRVIRWIKNKWLTGVLYGLIIWTIMNRLVVPLSNIPRKPAFDLTQAIIAAAILIAMIGIPVALIAGNYYKKQTTTD